MIRDLEQDEIYSPHFLMCVLWVTVIVVAACLAVGAVNAHYDDYLCTNPFKW